MTADQRDNHGERVTLRELVEQRFRLMDDALRVANEQMNRRLDAMNEFRASLKDQSSTMRTRQECDVISGKLEEDVRSLRESRAILEGKASQLSMNITLAIAIIGVVVSAVALFLK